MTTRKRSLSSKAKPARGRKPQPPGTGKPRRGGKRGALDLTRPLTQKQQDFVERFMVRRNITRAYLDSHPAAGYETARKDGSNLYRDPRVARQIKERLAQALKEYQHEGEKVLREISLLAFSSLADVYTMDGTIIPPAMLPREVAVAVKRIKRQEILGSPNDEGVRPVVGHTVELEMMPKMDALTKLGQHYGLFKEVLEVKPDADFADLMRAARERASSAR